MGRKKRNRRCSLVALTCQFNSLQANNLNESPANDFLDQILTFPNFVPVETALAGPDSRLSRNVATAGVPMLLQFSSGGGTGHIGAIGNGRGGGFNEHVFPLGLSLNQVKGGFLKPEEAFGSSKCFCDKIVNGKVAFC
ncbi:transcription factor UNE12-like [Gossypium hirsutum]|uniref:Transcription factor UNE12-like n=1 Tax=Gossypium hirsutum TaxID=3635 RepID=A0ABM2ZU80_GOSHI|nr:transcription factor UNE12-like [Gossypium hirsutum]